MVLSIHGGPEAQERPVYRPLSQYLLSLGSAVLAPNIRDSFGVSNGVIVFLASAAGAFLVLGALPMGWLADRFRRPKIIGWASLAFAGFGYAIALRTGNPAAVNSAFLLFFPFLFDPYLRL